MSFYGSMRVSFINAETELKLEKELRILEINLDSMIRVINVYKSGSGYTAWYYHDVQKGPLPKKTEKVKVLKKKKQTKKDN